MKYTERRVMMCNKVCIVLGCAVCLCVMVVAQEDVREPPLILEPTSSQELFFDERDVKLQCKAVGSPKPSYEWYWNGAPIESSPHRKISFDRLTSTLTIKKPTVREEGFYTCRAKNTFPNGMSAVAISPKIEVRKARIETWKKHPERTKTATEGSYVGITCGDKLPQSYGPTTFKWFIVKGYDDVTEILDDERVFIDSRGTLHFTYLLRNDEQSEQMNRYSCGMSNIVSGLISLGGRTRLTVTPLSTMMEVKPSLQYSSKLVGKDALTFERNTDGRLECFFSGYVSDQVSKVPAIEWFDNAGKKIVSGEDRYAIESEGRVLRIRKLVESDEKTFTCRGSNKLGSSESRMLLNVTSAPIWTQPLQSATVPQGRDAVFQCRARSARGENPPNPPRWFRNGQRLDLTYDPTKFEFRDAKRTLRVKSAQKDKDIACFQCYVGNSVGEVFSEGCLNVILPIQITYQPRANQTIEKGDVINLTVRATSDPLYPVSYKWHVKNKMYDAGKAPPYVITDVTTQEAYINTEKMTSEEMASIAGSYRREVYHEYEKVFVDVRVTVINLDSSVAVVEAGLGLWIIILVIVAAVIMIVVFIVICCSVCRRKMQEAYYRVGRKETAAGLDPEKELKENEFQGLAESGYDVPLKKRSALMAFEPRSLVTRRLSDNASVGSADCGGYEDVDFLGQYAAQGKM